MAPITIPNPVMIHIIEYYKTPSSILIRLRKGTATRKGMRFRFPMVIRSEEDLTQNTDSLLHDGVQYGVTEIADMTLSYDALLPRRKVCFRQTTYTTPQPLCPGGEPDDIWVTLRELHTLNFGSSSFIRDLALNAFRYYQRNNQFV